MDERGAGVIGTVAGVAVFLVLMLFGVQVLYGLYATSVVNAVTYDAAKEVAGSDGGSAAEADAEANARSRLGRFGEGVDFEWHDTGGDATRDVVILTVRAERPSMFPRELLGDSVLGDIVRTVRVRFERVR